jgi:hypothetical protein
MREHEQCSRCALRRGVSPSSSSILPSVSAWLASSKFSHCAYSTRRRQSARRIRQAHGGSGTAPALAVPGNCHGVRTSIFFTARVLPSDFRRASHTVANPPDLQAPWRRRQRQLPQRRLRRLRRRAESAGVMALTTYPSFVPMSYLSMPPPPAAHVSPSKVSQVAVQKLFLRSLF